MCVYSMRASRPWTTRCGLHRHMCTYTMRHQSTHPHTHPPPLSLSLCRGRPHASTRLIDIAYRLIVNLIDAEYRSMRARAWVDEVNAAEPRHTMTTLTTSTTTRVVRRRWTSAQGNRAMRAVSRGAVAMDGVEAIPRRKGARGVALSLSRWWSRVCVAHEGRARPSFSRA